MALTGMQVYKSLPRTNCKECGFPTCMAFAMQVAAKQKALTDCPHLSDEAKTVLSEASTPPMKLVQIGQGEKTFVFGQETVLFRHEEKFHRKSGLAVRIPANLSDQAVEERIARLKQQVFTRVGNTLRVALCAIEIDGVSDPAGRAKLVASKVQMPLILMGENSQAMGAAVAAIKSERPLIYQATPANFNEYVSIAASAQLPLAICADSLEQLSDLTQAAKDKGLNDLVLSFPGINKPGATLQNLTMVRRSALKKSFKPLGYPAMVELRTRATGLAPEMEALMGVAFAVKYAGIVIIDGLEPWQLLPMLTAIQDVHIDPQVPNMVDAKLYAIGQPTPESPVLFTTNFSLTYFSVAGEVERSKIPAYISVVDTEGLGVLNAYAGDKISPEKVVQTLQAQQVAEKVRHRRLIIPGLLPMYRAELEDTSDWKEIIIGPENAREIPGFLNKLVKA